MNPTNQQEPLGPPPQNVPTIDLHSPPGQTLKDVETTTFVEPPSTEASPSPTTREPEKHLNLENPTRTGGENQKKKKKAKVPLLAASITLVVLAGIALAATLKFRNSTDTTAENKAIENRVLTPPREANKPRKISPFNPGETQQGNHAGGVQKQGFDENLAVEPPLAPASLLGEIDKPLPDGNAKGTGGFHDMRDDHTYLPENEALPKDMIEGEVLKVEPTLTQAETPRSVIDTAQAVAPQEDPEFASRRQKLRDEELRYEPVDLKVQHTITALFPIDQKTPPQKVRLDVPVIHESQLLALTKPELESLKDLMAQTRDYQKKIQDLEAEGTQILIRWNEIQRAGSPESILLPDSPSLIENQGSTKVTGQSSPLTGNNETRTPTSPQK